VNLPQDERIILLKYCAYICGTVYCVFGHYFPDRKVYKSNICKPEGGNDSYYKEGFYVPEKGKEDEIFYKKISGAVIAWADPQEGNFYGN